MAPFIRGKLLPEVLLRVTLNVVIIRNFLSTCETRNNLKII